jgi:hypothetical protein
MRSNYPGRLIKSLSQGMGSGLRYGLSISLLGISLILLGLSAHLVTTPAARPEQSALLAAQWASRSCENSLQRAGIAYAREGYGVTVLLESAGRIDEQVFMQADLALLSCPGMRAQQVCIGQCEQESISLRPAIGRGAE